MPRQKHVPLYAYCGLVSFFHIVQIATALTSSHVFLQGLMPLRLPVCCLLGLVWCLQVQLVLSDVYPMIQGERAFKAHASQFNTDLAGLGLKQQKDPIKRHSFQTMFGMYLVPMRNQTIKVLMIGGGCIGKPTHRGGSVKLMTSLLPYAELWVAENKNVCRKAMQVRPKPELYESKRNKSSPLNLVT